MEKGKRHFNQDRNPRRPSNKKPDFKREREDDALSVACGAEQVQVIGTKFVLFKRNTKEPKIDLKKETVKGRK